MMIEALDTPISVVHDVYDLMAIFHDCFAKDYNTKLIKGDDEPIYLPANEACTYHSVVFAHGFFSSALHECAHWLIAGDKRRTQVDYGYWYAPDGRTAEQQQLFQQVEVKPQALEWILSDAAHYPFQFSFDNLTSNDALQDMEAFKLAVYQQKKRYCEQGLWLRAERFRLALMDFYTADQGMKKSKLFRA